MEGVPRCRKGNADAAEACYAKKEKKIRGPWRFYFDVPSH